MLGATQRLYFLFWGEVGIWNFPFLPEHLAQALQHAFLGFVLVLVLVAVFVPLGFLLLLPGSLVPLPLPVLSGEAAVQSGSHDVVAARGHGLATRSGASLRVLVHWSERG